MTKSTNVCNKANKGFTLIELMIVVAIIAILAGIAVPQYKSYTDRAKFSEVIAATTSAKTAAEMCAQVKQSLDAAACASLDVNQFSVPTGITLAFSNQDATNLTITATKGSDSYELAGVLNGSGVLEWATTCTPTENCV